MNNTENILEERIKELELRNEELESEISSLSFENSMLMNQWENVRLLTETINETFWLIDSITYEVLYINQSFARMFDLSIGDVVSNKDSWINNIHESDKEFVKNEYQTKAMNGEYDIEYRIVHNSGKIHWVRDRTFPIKNKNINKIARLTEFITQKKYSNKMMLESQKNLQVIMENTSAGILILNKDFKTVYVNNTLPKMLGYDYDTLIKVDPINAVAKEYRALVSQNFKRRFDGESFPNRYEIELININGEHVSVEIRTSIVVYNQQTCNLITLSDIREYKEIVAQLKNNSNYLNSIIESSKNIYIFSIDNNFTLKVINKNAKRLFSELCNEVLNTGDNISHLFTKSNYTSKILSSLKKALNGLEIENINKEIIKDEIYYFEKKISPIYNDNNKIEGVVTYINNITELIKTQEKLQEINESKDKFFSILAHDLKSPIATFSTLIKFILKEEIENPIILETLEELGKTSKNIKVLLDNLLEWSYTMRGDFILEKQDLSIYFIIEDIKLLFSHRIQKKNITINNNVEKELTIKGNGHTIRAIFRNVIHNSIKYSNIGGEINIDLYDEIDNYKVIVEDFGVGIDKSRMENLFQLDKMSSIEGTDSEIGTGLGLILCKEYMLKNEGEIEVNSTHKKGTKVILSFKK